MKAANKALILCALVAQGILIGTSSCLAAPSKTAPSTASEIVIDAIVASVDDKPITLSDLTSRLSPPRRLTLAEAGKDSEALKVLDQIILEKILEEEAKAKRLSVSDTEVDEYVHEVAERNNLSPADFQAALIRDGHTLERYKQQIKMDILKAKLSASISRGGTSTTDSEIDQYIASHPHIKHTGKNIKLHRIVISKQGRTPEEVGTKMTEVTTALSSGESFMQVAQRFSDSAGSSDGSLLGIIAAQDLSPAIAEVVSPLQAGEHSSPMETPNDIQIFFVEERFGAEGDSEDVDEDKLRNEVRQILQKQKTQDRLAAYFTKDLYNNHAIDKKL